MIINDIANSCPLAVALQDEKKREEYLNNLSNRAAMQRLRQINQGLEEPVVKTDAAAAEGEK